EGIFPKVKRLMLRVHIHEFYTEYDPVSIIRREIAPSGKSRAFVNDSPVRLETLKVLGIKLMDVHSQHETLNLGKNTFQLSFIDAYSNSIEDRKKYRSSYLNYKNAEKKLSLLKAENEEIMKEADYNNFILNELVDANLVAGEQEELEASQSILENAEDIKLKLNESLEALSSSEFASLTGLQQAKNLLQQLGKYSPTFDQLKDRLESTFIEISDIVQELEKEEDLVDVDPEQIEYTQDRLSLIYRLQKKHSTGKIEDLIDIQEQLQKKSDRFLNMEEEIEGAEAEVNRLREVALKEANQLSKRRVKCFDKLTNELLGLLEELGMGQSSIKIENTQGELTATGIDNINILFSANKGIIPRELSKVASGGEFSRLMFCIKYILAGKVALPTIIFDEIDTGISGEVSLKMASMMKKMAKNHQVVAITHLPQIAAKGDQHYFVYKDNSEEKAFSKIKTLTEEERTIEIAKMIGGESPSSVAIESAKELIDT
ncbi:MAG: DNA repair protein RecN, partial [Bacteroidota bacterium]